jgi:hypothetical protein
MSEVQSLASHKDDLQTETEKVHEQEDDWYIVSQLQLLKQFEQKEEKLKRLEHSKQEFRDELAR